MLVQFKFDSGKSKPRNKPRCDRQKKDNEESDDNKSSDKEEEKETHKDVNFVNTSQDNVAPKEDNTSEIKCYSCGNPGFTTKTYPKCNMPNKEHNVQLFNAHSDYSSNSFHKPYNTLLFHQHSPSNHEH
jgi:hypothetical protein